MGAICTTPLEQAKMKNGSVATSRTTISSRVARNGPENSANEASTLSQGSGVLNHCPGSGSRQPSAATMSTLHQFPELSARYRKVMRGDLDEHLAAKAKIVRIFTSSTFTDTAAERNALMERVYPKLKEFAQEKGYEFQVVDMRWGVRDESADDHTTLELCLKELEACQELSTGPNFVTFLGQKYGFRPFPSNIMCSEYEQLFSGITDQEEKQLLQTWFKCDFNTVPPMYVLQPVSSQIPGYLSDDAGERKLALEDWKQCFTKIQKILRREARKTLQDEEQVHKYFMSVTESEIRRGVLCASDPERQCCWISRIIRDLQDHERDEKAQYFIDIDSSTGEIDTEPLELLLKLKTDIVVKNLPSSNIRTFDVKWTSKGISPSSVPEHAQYIERMCGEFEELMKEMITDAVRVRTETDVNNPLYEEVVQHMSFCQTKCSTFYGREEILKRCKAYLQEDKPYPLLIYGQSGCGKTSVVSMVAKGTRNWLSQSNLIIRYIGTTPNSSQGRLMLFSVCQQICSIYGSDPAAIRNEMKDLREDFVNCLHLATAEEPLVIFFDSLDQFGSEDNVRQLDWLPMNLPAHVKVVVSTLPDSEYQCFPVLQTFLPEDCFVEVPKLPEDDAFQIITNWLKMERRKLSSTQEVIVNDALQKCSLPIFIRVAFDEAVRWKSYSPLNDTVLQDTVRGAINALFERVERQHGQVLVRRALAYITAAKSGLTGTELEDLLSCDDYVLDDVYQYWTPPIRRIPPLLWVRIRGDLAGYLVDRGADSARVITWYHRQFIEAARARYLSSGEERLGIHRSLSTYFLGVWANGRKKPYETKAGETLEADRFVAHQPWTFEGSRKRRNFNYRKISELPYHLALSNEIETLKREVLCNFQFLLTALESSSLRDILDDFDFALQNVDDEDIQLVKETLQLSTFALLQHPAQLPSQFLGRISNASCSEFINSLLIQAKKPRKPCLIPSAVCLTSPGGPLVHSMSGQNKPTSALTTSNDGRLIASASADTTCRIWDVNSGRLMRTLEGFGTDVWWVVISPNNSVVVISAVGCISAWRLSTGQRIFSVEGHASAAPVCALETEDTVALAALIKGTLRLYHLETGLLLQEIVDDQLQNYNDMSSSFVMCGYGDHSILYAGRDSLLPDSGGWVRAIDVNTGSIVETIRLNARYVVHSIGVTKPGLLLLALSEGGSSLRKGSAVQISFFNLELWNISNCTIFHSLTSLSDKVRCYALSLNKSKVLTLGNSRFLNGANIYKAEIKIFDVQSLEVVERILNYPSAIHLIELVDLNHVVTASRDNIIRVWDFERNVPNTPDVEHDEDADQEIVDVFAHFAICWEKTGLRLLNLQTGHFVHFVNGVQPQVAFVNDNEVIIVSFGKLHLYNLSRRQMILQFRGNVCEALRKNCFVYNQDQLVAVSSEQRSLYVYDITSGERTAELLISGSELIRRLVHTPDGEICVCGHRTISDENEAKSKFFYTVWDLEHKICIREIAVTDEAEADFYDMQLTQDGRHLLDVVYDPNMKLYRAVVYAVKSGRLVFLSDAKFHVHSSSISSKNNTILLGLFDGTMELYNLENGTCLHTVTAHLGAVHRIYTATAGSVAMTTAGGLDSKDRSIKVWSVDDGKITLLTMFTPDAKISSMTLTDDGCFAALEITEVVPFCLVGRTQEREQQPKNTRTFSRSFEVDLKDFKVVNP